MKLSDLARELYDEIAKLTIIDAHEHLPAEAEYLKHGYSGPNMFSHYLRGDLASAGIPAELSEKLRSDDPGPVGEWWPQLKPYWECVKNTSYARALKITARDLWGIDEINDDTIDEFSGHVQADNTPGLYRRILQEKCNIRTSITCIGQAAFPDDPCIVGITPATRFATGRPDTITSLAEYTGREIRTLDDATDAVQSVCRSEVEAGAVGFKISVSDFTDPDEKKAEAEFKDMIKSPEEGRRYKELRNYLFDKAIDVAAEKDVPVAVHTGYWGDFRTLDPKLMLDFCFRRTDVHFDVFHLGMPMIRDAMLIGKTIPNVSLNLVWCAIISQVQTKRSLDELIDLVPVNKIIAFGGDYGVCVQKAYGHLVMAREVIAQAFAKRIEAGDFDRDYALHLAKMWFHDNPARIYRLPTG